jgi:H+/Cl- antiporter ClcA/predicted transcriptional regulator
MEQVLTNQSRIPARITFLKPISAAIAIGTGGPFGAEGPIIATGSALGSLFGQIMPMTAMERKTLLAAGAAAGMTATFGSPVAAVLLAIELLLFEYRPRSIIPVALASVMADGVRMMFVGMGPMFAMSDLAQPTGAALAAYIVLGGVMGLVASVVTRLVYAIEDGFELLPVHWMWWPAIGAIAVGVMGYISPDTLGVGYRNITGVLSGHLAASAMLVLAVAKFISWSISLGSGTSGGTMAPLFTIGGALGGAAGAAHVAAAPALGVDVRIAALVGMAAMFAGASRAMLACAVFAFETTLQPVGLLPLLGGCAAAYLTSSLLSKNSLMTEKIERRGIRAPAEYTADVLDQVLIRTVASKHAVSLRAEDTVGKVRAWLASGAEGASHQGFPVLDDRQVLVGVLTRKDLLDPAANEHLPLAEVIKRSPKFVYEDLTVRQAAHHMANHQVGRLPVVSRAAQGGKPEVVGMITRSDILSVFQRHVQEAQRQQPTIRWRGLAARRNGSVEA